MYLLAITIPLALLIVATVCDIRTREVPNWISVAILLWATTATGFGFHGISWGPMLLGMCLGFVVGAIVFYVGGLGGADVKLIAAIGALLGPLALLFVLFWMALAGGLLALVAAARGHRDFAYVPAITTGFAVYLFYPGGLWQHLFHS